MLIPSRRGQCLHRPLPLPLTVTNFSFNLLKIEDYKKSTEGEKVFVAERNKQVVGFISIWEADSFIHNLFVDPNHLFHYNHEKSRYPSEEEAKCIMRGKTCDEV